MTKKAKHAKKVTRNPKRAKAPAQPDLETETATQSVLAEAPQAAPAIPEADIGFIQKIAISLIPKRSLFLL